MAGVGATGGGSNQQAPAIKLRVFVSYSRRDEAFARELVAGLKLTGFEPFLDQHDIAPGEEWEMRLGHLIEMADTIVFVVTEGSIASEHCLWEVRRTLQSSKRLIPVVAQSVDQTIVPIELKRLNYIFFDKPYSFATSLTTLADALRSDLDWTRQHTQWADGALRWHAASKADAYLIRGDELVAAKLWLADQPQYAPEPTLLTREFISTSETVELARQNEERKRLEQIAAAQNERAVALEAEKAALQRAETANTRTLRLQRQRVRLAFLTAVIAIVFGGIAIAFWRGAETATEKLRVAFTLAQKLSKNGVAWEVRELLENAPAFEDISLGQVKVLWVDDNPGNNVSERTLLEVLGAKIACARSSQEALKFLASNTVDVIISDFVRPNDPCDRHCLLEKLKEASSLTGPRKSLSVAARSMVVGGGRQPLIYYTGSCTDEMRTSAMKAGAFEETNSPEHLISAVVRATRDDAQSRTTNIKANKPVCTPSARMPTEVDAKHEFAACSLTSAGPDQ